MSGLKSIESTAGGEVVKWAAGIMEVSSTVKIDNHNLKTLEK